MRSRLPLSLSPSMILAPGPSSDTRIRPARPIDGLKHPCPHTGTPRHIQTLKTAKHNHTVRSIRYGPPGEFLLHLPISDLFWYGLVHE